MIPKPCPWCGGSAVLVKKEVKTGYKESAIFPYWCVECTKCQLRTLESWDHQATKYGCENGEELALFRWNAEVDLWP